MATDARALTDDRRDALPAGIVFIHDGLLLGRHPIQRRLSRHLALQRSRQVLHIDRQQLIVAAQGRVRAATHGERGRGTTQRWEPLHWNAIEIFDCAPNTGVSTGHEQQSGILFAMDWKRAALALLNLPCESNQNCELAATDLRTCMRKWTRGHQRSQWCRRLNGAAPCVRLAWPTPFGTRRCPAEWPASWTAPPAATRHKQQRVVSQ